MIENDLPVFNFDGYDPIEVSIQGATRVSEPMEGTFGENYGNDWDLAYANRSIDESLKSSLRMNWLSQTFGSCLSLDVQ